MIPNGFVDAFAAINEIFGELTPEERIEERYYDILNNISIALVEYRIKHNLNQKQLSEKLGVAQSMVSKYESGDYNISIKSLNELCGKLGFSLNVNISIPEETENTDSPDVSDMNSMLAENYVLAS